MLPTLTFFPRSPWNRFQIMFLWISVHFCKAQLLHSRTDQASSILRDAIAGFAASKNTDLLHGFQFLHLLNVSSLNHGNVLLSWKIDLPFYDPPNQCDFSTCQRSWAVTIRNLDVKDSEHELSNLNLNKYMSRQIHWQPTDVPYIDILPDLLPNNLYEFCLSLAIDGELYQDPKHCKYLQTNEAVVRDSLKDTIQSFDNFFGEELSNNNVEDNPESQLTISKSKYNIFLSWSSSIFTTNNSGRSVTSQQLPVVNDKGWRIRLRKFAESNETEIDLLLNERGSTNSKYNYTIVGLESNTGYVVCFQVLNEKEKELKTNDFLRSSDKSVFKIEDTNRDNINTDSDKSKDELNKEFKLNNEETQTIDSNTDEKKPIMIWSTTENPQPQRHFVYTSTGERLAIPNIPGGPLIAGNFPVVSPFFETRSDPISKTDKPEPGPDETPERQTLTFRTNIRQKRSILSSTSEIYPSGQCYEIMTEDDNNEYVMIMSLIIAIVTSMILTIITFFICCWLRRCYKNNSCVFRSHSGSNKDRKIHSISSPIPTNLYNCRITDEGSIGKSESITYVKNPNFKSTKNTIESDTLRLDKPHFHTSQTCISEGLDGKPNECRKRSLSNMALKKTSKGLLFDNKDELVKEEKIDFHPGYDVPPSSTKKIFGYDYPTSIPVNTLDEPGRRSRYPSRSSCESNWNNHNDSSNTSMNYNIPCDHSKYSDKTKDLTYDVFDSEAPRSINNRQFKANINECPVLKLRDHRNSHLKHTELSRSAPNLYSIENDNNQQPDYDMGTKTLHAKGGVRVTHLPSIPKPVKIRNNISPRYLTRIDTSENQVPSVTTDNSEYIPEIVKKEDKVQSIGDVILTGGTLIEVPEGYVVPGKPIPSSVVRVTVTSSEA